MFCESGTFCFAVYTSQVQKIEFHFIKMDNLIFNVLFDRYHTLLYICAE